MLASGALKFSNRVNIEALKHPNSKSFRTRKFLVGLYNCMAIKLSRAETGGGTCMGETTAFVVGWL